MIEAPSGELQHRDSGIATILIVDDHATNRDLLVEIARYAGHRTLAAADGAEAIAIARSERPQLVISDILMPTMDGFEFVKQLRAEPELAAIEVIFYTAHYHQREARNLARACGVSRVLEKPSKPDLIIRTIEEALARAPQALPVVPDGFDRDHLRLMTDKLSENVAELQAANFRLAALNRVNLELASEGNPDALLNAVCRDARELLGARYAMLCVRGREDAGVVFHTGSGFGKAAFAALPAPSIDAGALGRVLARREIARGTSEPGNSPIDLPQGYPAADTWIAAPVASLTVAYGWICLLDKIGGEAFGEEDERILGSLAAQVGRVYENVSLFSEVKRNAADLERRVAERTADLEAANKELESFSFSVSHDLRAPLRAIDGFIGILARDHAPRLDSAARGLIERVQANAERMSQIIDDLLALARTSGAEMQRRPIALDPIVRRCLDEMKDEIAARGAQVVVGALPRCEADASLVTQVFQNLLSNALKYSRGSSPPTIEVGFRDEAGECAIFVRDNGVGFDMAHADNLFGVFHRMHTQSEFEGTGVGLAIVQRIIARHGGRVWAQSSPGKGATFFFALPEAGGPRAPENPTATNPAKRA